jgi:mRNA interferase HicA
MKRKALIKHLRAHGCLPMQRKGTKHEVWINPSNNRESVVPRHTEIKTGTSRGICRQLEIPDPPSR